MGNAQQSGLRSSFGPTVVVPEVQRLSHVKRVIQYHNSCLQDTTKKNFKTYELGDVQVYGQFDPKTNELTGYGSLKIDGEMVFEGEFINSLKNGYGIEYEGGKVLFEGNYVNDKRDGWGKTSTYYGEYCRDKRHGWGIEITLQDRYEGYWKNDLYEGMGVIYYGRTEDTDQLLSIVTGKGPLSTEIPCDVYVGEWKEGKKNGVGKLKTSKESYQGEFANDVYHGQGTLFSGNAMCKGIFDRGAFLSK